MDLTQENHHGQLLKRGQSSRTLNRDFITAIIYLVFQKLITKYDYLSNPPPIILKTNFGTSRSNITVYSFLSRQQAFTLNNHLFPELLSTVSLQIKPS